MDQPIGPESLVTLRREYGTGASQSALLTDLYQLNMVQAYLEAGMAETAVFEFFVRKLPAERGFLLAAGLEQVVAYLRSMRTSDAELRWLQQTGRFGRNLIEYLREVRFEGDVDAVPEGTVVFADEPILRVVAPLPVAQLVETRIINLLHLETLIASKAARMVLAAPGKVLVDFGFRRAHGMEAGLLAARASYLAGFAGTATVPAEPLFGIPIFGTMAHSYIQAHMDEMQAFEDFARARPDNLVLLIDTYHTEAAAEKVVRLAPRLKQAGIAIAGVRLDSGDLAAHARNVRAILDRGGLKETRILASGGLTEAELQRFVHEEVPIDGFGIGTKLTTSYDAAALDCAYKLQEYAGTPRRKRSEGKATWPGRKQVFRRYAEDGTIASDLLALDGEVDEGEPLLRPVLRGGRQAEPLPSLEEARAHASRQLERLPAPLRQLQANRTLTVEVSKKLQALARQLDTEESHDVSAAFS